MNKIVSFVCSAILWFIGVIILVAIGVAILEGMVGIVLNLTFVQFLGICLLVAVTKVLYTFHATVKLSFR